MQLPLHHPHQVPSAALGQVGVSPGQVRQGGSTANPSLSDTGTFSAFRRCVGGQPQPHSSCTPSDSYGNGAPQKYPCGPLIVSVVQEKGEVGKRRCMSKDEPQEICGDRYAASFRGL